MKYVWLLVISLLMVGCVVEPLYPAPWSSNVITGWVEACDDFGCREVWAPHYYSSGDVVYYDEHFECWVGPRGYWVGGIWHRGWIGGYHEYYRSRGWYRTPAYHGYHGGFHGGHHR